MYACMGCMRRLLAWVVCVCVDASLARDVRVALIALAHTRASVALRFFLPCCVVLRKLWGTWLHLFYISDD